VFEAPRSDLTIVEFVPKERWTWIHLDVRNRDGVIQRMRFSAGWERQADEIRRALW
jgi:hypothetical protein